MGESFRSTREVILQVKSLAAATRFYEKALGVSVVMQHPGLAKIETGSFCFYVEEGKSPGPVFEFLVDDLAAAKAALIERGCEVVDENPEIPRCYLRDPFGLVFNIAER